MNPIFAFMKKKLVGIRPSPTRSFLNELNKVETFNVESCGHKYFDGRRLEVNDKGG